MRKRVVITGLGAVTPIGIGVDDYWDGLLAGRAGVERITLFDPSPYPCHIAAEVKGFDSTRFFDRKRARLLARPTQFGVASALLCLEDADWQRRPGPPGSATRHRMSARQSRMRSISTGTAASCLTG